MQQLPEGTYLLRRTAGSSVVQCLRALPDSHAQAADIETIHDATAKRRSAGATDAENLDFVPIRWQARLASRCFACDSVFLTPRGAIRRLRSLACSKSRSHILPSDSPACCRAALLGRSGCLPGARRRRSPRRRREVIADNRQLSGVRIFATVTLLPRAGPAVLASAARSRT